MMPKSAHPVCRRRSYTIDPLSGENKAAVTFRAIVALHHFAPRKAWKAARALEGFAFLAATFLYMYDRAQHPDPDLGRMP